MVSGRDSGREEVFARICSSIEAARAGGLTEADVLEYVSILTVSIGCEAERGMRPRSQLLQWAVWGARLFLYRLLPIAIGLLVFAQPLLAILRKDPCLVRQLLAGEWSMPVCSCEVCVGVTRVAVVEEDSITEMEFMEKYAYSSHPLLVKGAASSWPATEVFSYGYFKQLYSQRPEAIEEDQERGLFFTYKSSLQTLERFLLNSSSEKDWYISW